MIDNPTSPPAHPASASPKAMAFFETCDMAIERLRANGYEISETAMRLLFVSVMLTAPHRRFPLNETHPDA